MDNTLGKRYSKAKEQNKWIRVIATQVGADHVNVSHRCIHS